MWLDRLQKSNCLYGILLRVRDLKQNPGGGGVIPYISHLGIVNSRLSNTPIIRTAAKFPGKNKLQTFDLNKFPLLRTLANEDSKFEVPKLSAIKGRLTVILT